MPAEAKLVRDLFLAAAELPVAERGAYLASQCGGDPELQAAVGRLLAAHDEPASVLVRPAPGMPTADYVPIIEKPGTTIGPYKLVERIGEGGMGEVWMAQQTEPVRRMVALKLIKPGMDSRAVLARFEAERQALALMDHPNIAKVLDAGPTADGRPYFVMELVKGVPITKFCDERHLTPRQRLELFVPICQAIQHAHQKGIIHRDIKPSNVLVALYDDKPVPKVIDFGVAKATGQQLTEKSLHTGFGAVVGTPEYMSPEQAGFNQLDVDTRSDVYSLGVLLYELLTGSPPFSQKDLERAGMLEMLRVIREEEPSKPSTKLSTADGLPTLAANRGTEPKRLTKLVRGELDWIVMKALDKHRSRRYETANSFAMDVQRYLADEPVQACPPSAWYRFRKFARRNKAALLTASAAALAVLLAVAGLAVGYAQITQALWREKQILEREQQTSYFQRIASAARESAADNLGRAEELLDECPSHLRGWEWHYLKRRRYEEPRELPHAAAVVRVAYSPDGRYLATGCLDGSVTVWDRRSGQRLHSWKGGPDAHDAHIYSIAFSPDSRQLATGGNDHRILVWDLDAGTLRHRFDGHTQSVTQLAFRPDGRHLASASEDGTVRLWDLKTGREEFSFHEHHDAVRGVAFAAQGQLISVGADGNVKIWDPSTGAVAGTFRGRSRWVSALAFHADSQRLALASWDGSVELWDTLWAKETRTLYGHAAQITSLAFSPDGRRLASAGDDKLLKVWDASTGHEAITFEVEQVPIGVAFSPDGLQLACGYARPDPVLKLWDGTPLSAKEGNGRALSVIGHDEPVVRVAFSPDGRCLASASRDGTAKIYDAVTGREMFTFRGHNALVSAVAFSPDGQRVASGSWDEKVFVWDAASGQVLHTLSADAGFVHDVAFSPDGRTLASAYSGGTVVLWDPCTGKALRPPIRVNHTEVTGIAFSPDSKLLATAGGRDVTAKIWMLATGEERAALPGVMARVWGVAFSPDGQSVAASLGRYVTVWDATNGNAVRTKFPTESSRGCHLAFHPDSRWLASAGWDETVRVWDARTGQQVALLRGHAGHVLGVAFSPDGRRLASCGGYRGKGEIKIWNAALWENNQAPSRER